MFVLRRCAAAGALALLLAAPLPALAHQCPTLTARIDELLAGTELDPSVREDVELLRTQGAGLHEEGAHDDAEAVLLYALQLLEAAAH